MSRRRVSLPTCLFTGILMLTCLNPLQAAQPDQEPEAVPGQLIVLLAHGGETPTPEEVVESHRRGRELPGGLGVGHPESVKLALVHRARGPAKELLNADPDNPRARLERYLLVTYPESANLDAIQRALELNPHVLHVERNYVFELHVSPSDPHFPVASDPTLYQWGSHLLNFPAAWDYAKGHAYVGLLDTGLQKLHEDLVAIDPGGTYRGGSFREHLSWDFGDGDTNVDEIQGATIANAGHGTHVSGIVAATTNNLVPGTANGIGTAGACWGCSLLMAKVVNANKEFSLSTDKLSNALSFVVDNGSQVVSMSLGRSLAACLPGNCPKDLCQEGLGDLSMFCTAISLAETRDVSLLASSGNHLADIQFPASDPRFVAVGGIEPGGAFWDRRDDEGCPLGGFNECGSNYTVSAGRKQQDLVAPASKVLSTFYTGREWNGFGCGDSHHPAPGYGLCTGTSMSSPYAAGLAGILRSVNPLLSKAQIRDALTSNASRGGSWDPQLGYGYPNASASVQAVLGRANGVVLANRLTPLFSLYSTLAEDHFYTTAPQMATAALFQIETPYQTKGPAVPGYPQYPGGQCNLSPCWPADPSASVYIFTTDKAPFAGAPPLVPLYRMSFEGATPTNPSNKDTAYTTHAAEPDGIEEFAEVGYRLDGIEGYIFPFCTAPGCQPAGTVPLYRRYNPERDDFAIFPDSELPQMVSEGYTSNGGGNEVIGFVYLNADADFDHVINGFEGLIGIDPSRGDSDCDGLADGAEILGYPNTDPRIANSGPGCIPPVARFTFICSGLACSFDSSGSTDNVGIVSRSWSFGGSSVTAGFAFAATGTYTVTLTVTDTHGLRSSASKQVSVNGDSPLPAENYFSVAPCRLVDTRTSTPLNSGQLYVFNVAGNCGIPATAKAVSFNVGVASATGPGHLVFFPGNQSSGPFLHSTTNFLPVPSPRFNNATLRLATNGTGTLALRGFALATPGQFHLILDVYGYFGEDTTPAPGAQGPFGYQTVTPCRLADTRVPTPSPLSHDVSRSFTVQGVCGVPVGAAVGMLNLVAVTPTDAGYLQMFPAGTSAPSMETIRWPAVMLAQANGAMARLAASTPDVTVQFTGTTSTTGTSHVILDAFGYFKSDAPLKYRPITPCRAVDTRFSDQGGPILTNGIVRSFQIQGNCGVPVGAKAAMVNIVAVGPTGPGHLVAFASGTTFPATSTLNFHPAQGNLANGTIVPLSTNADDLSLLAAVSSTHVVVDVFGYFQ